MLEESNEPQQNLIVERTRNRLDLARSMEVGHCFVSVREPLNYEGAVKSNDNEKWKEAMDQEFNSLIENQTWQLLDLLKNRNIIDNRWVYKIKETTTGQIERFKARLVVRRFTQGYGVDYSETYSLLVRYSSIRAIMSVAAMENLKMSQFDVKLRSFMVNCLSKFTRSNQLVMRMARREFVYSKRVCTDSSKHQEIGMKNVRNF